MTKPILKNKSPRQAARGLDMTELAERREDDTLPQAKEGVCCKRQRRKSGWMVVVEVMVVWWGGACGQGTRGSVRIYLVGKGRDHQGGNAKAGGWSGVVPFPVQARLRQGREASWSSGGRPAVQC
jgi:hypothetical protein